MVAYSDFVSKLESHKYDILLQSIKTCLKYKTQDQIPILIQKITDIRAEIQNKIFQKKTITDDIFEIDFVLKTLIDLQEKDANLILLEDCLIEEKNNLKEKIESLNIEKLSNKLNNLEKEMNLSEFQIQKLNFILDIGK